MTTAAFIRKGKVIAQRRRAKRSDAGAKRPHYKRRKERPAGPLRGLSKGDAALVDNQERRAFSNILDEMSPPKRRKADGHCTTLGKAT